MADQAPKAKPDVHHVAQLTKDWSAMTREEKDAFLKEMTEAVHGPGSFPEKTKKK